MPQHSMFDSLELRRLLAVTSTLGHGVLHVTGTSGNDEIHVGAISRAGSLRLIVTSGTGDQLQTWEYTPGDFRRVNVETGDGNDKVVIGTLPDALFSKITGATAMPTTLRSHIDGGRGNDTLVGGYGQDTITGAKGNDLIIGGNRNDILAGSAGNDTIDGGFGADTMGGGGGNDWLDYSRRTNAVYVRLRGNVVELAGTRNSEIATADVILIPRQHSLYDQMGEANENDDIGPEFEAVLGGTADDRLEGNSSKNTLIGGRGNDSLDGREGDDSLIGGSGDDSITGWNGNDFLDGGAGDDLLGAAAYSFSIIEYSTQPTEWPDLSGIDTLHGGGGTDKAYFGKTDILDEIPGTISYKGYGPWSNDTNVTGSNE